MTSIATEKLGYQDFPFKSGYVAIIGNPNVGKSTTMNSILNQKLSIVSPKPQTTRHDILGILSDPNYQIVFTDTPGFIDNPQYNLQNEMNNKIREIAVNGSIFMVLSDCFGLPLNRSIIARINRQSSKSLVVINKLDILVGKDIPEHCSHYYFPANQSLVNTGFDMSKYDSRTKHTVDELHDYWRTMFPSSDILFISAKLGYNIDRLRSLLVSFAQIGPRYYPSDYLSDRNERFFASEIIREVIFHKLHDEIPYSCEVRIDTFIEKSDVEALIKGTIFVEKESQKIIAIGKQGNMIKAIGMQARLKLQEFLDKKIHLNLEVKVLEDWRRNKFHLKKLGYIDD